MTGHAERASAVRRAAVLGAVILGHLSVLVAFLNESAPALQQLNVPVQASIIEQRRLSPPPPPPPPRVQLLIRLPRLPPLDVPQPTTNLSSPVPVVADRPSPPAQYVPLALLSRPNADAYYPAEATRRHVSGQTVARVCVDADARLASAQIVRSSGHAELDAATLLMIQHQAWKAATIDGKPIKDCRALLFTFKLRSQLRAGDARSS